MKKIKISLIFIFALFSGTINAQQSNKHEVNFGYGAITTNSIIDGLSDFLVTGLTAGEYRSKNKSYTGSFYVGYKNALSKRISVGGTFAYEKISSDAFYGDIQEGKFKNNYFTLAAEADLKYVNTQNLRLYSTLGLGATMIRQGYSPNSGEDDHNNITHFNFQITPIGIKYGDKFGVFGELGFGYKGIFTAGVFARF